MNFRNPMILTLISTFASGIGVVAVALTQHLPQPPPTEEPKFRFPVR